MILPLLLANSICCREFNILIGYQIPVCYRQSWASVNHTLAQKERLRNLASDCYDKCIFYTLVYCNMYITFIMKLCVMVSVYDMSVSNTVSLLLPGPHVHDFLCSSVFTEGVHFHWEWSYGRGVGHCVCTYDTPSLHMRPSWTIDALVVNIF